MVGDELISWFCGRQHGMIASDQERRAGLSPDTIQYRRKQHRLFRVHPTVDANTPGPYSFIERCMAAVLAGGPGALLGGPHAARVRGAWRAEPRGPIQVIVPRRHRAVPGVKFIVMPGATGRRIDGVPCVDLPFMMLTLARTFTLGQMINVLHEAAFHEPVDVDDIHDLLDERRNVEGATTLRRALKGFQRGDLGTGSGIDDRVAAGLQQRGVPEPEFSPEIDVGGRKPIHPDLVWRDRMVCIELDGKPHERAATRRRDVEKSTALRATGWKLRRVKDGELARDFDGVLDELARFVRRHRP
jgi:hypothetical protein